MQMVNWAGLEGGDASQAAALTTEAILNTSSKHIPQRMLRAKKSTHPWLNDDLVELVAAKRAAVGTPGYEEALKACSDGIMSEYNKYACRARERLLETKKGSKRWWTICRELLSQRAKIQSIPAMKSDEGSWVHEPSGKADLLAGTFSGKNVLPEVRTNEYTKLEPTIGRQRVIRQLTVREAAATLAALDEHSGTGPDLLPSRILKHCAQELAYPVLKLTMLILNSGEWPQVWREHWVVPLHKRNAIFLPINYRGVHLTAQLSKVIERLLLSLMVPHITLWNLTGENQFAYSKRKGSRDVLALLSLRWLKALENGHKVLVYCSDVSGAFDKVSRERLLDKLAAKGIHPMLVKLLGSWLEPRQASVVVGGAKSKPFRIQDMVFQGTVLGPQLWNLFFEDAAAAIKEHLYEEVIFADDLNAYKVVPSTTTLPIAMQSIDKVQAGLHRWGTANQVTFDASKESRHVLSRTDPHGPDFKLLGVVFDCRLTMEGAVRSLAGKVKWKLQMLLRSRRSFCTQDLVLQYKQQLLSFIEYRTGAIYHATTTVLNQLDRTQDNFFRELGIDSTAALMDFNLAPLSMRRDIALLGILHRAALGEGPPQFREYFRRKEGSLRLVDPLENKTLSPLMRRSRPGPRKPWPKRSTRRPNRTSCRTARPACLTFSLAMRSRFTSGRPAHSSAMTWITTCLIFLFEIAAGPPVRSILDPPGFGLCLFFQFQEVGV